MSDGVTLKRIIDLDTQSSISDGVYTIVDSETDKAKKFNLGGALSDLDDALDQILVEKHIIDPVTLKNIVNTRAFVFSAASGSGFTNPTYSGDIGTYTGGNGSEANPFRSYNGGWGTKKWIWGLKFKLTKLSENVPTINAVRFIFGASTDDTRIDIDPTWDEWINFAAVRNVDLTRIYIATRFSSAPSSNAFKIEIKDMYLYDASGLDNDTCNYIMEQQESGYKDGTVTYESIEYIPDTSLSLSGKVADAKATGDAINEIVSGLNSLIETKSVTIASERNINNLVGQYGLSVESTVDGVRTYIPSSSPDTSPAVRDTCALGNGRWAVGFKYKITKLDETLGDPQYLLVYLGATERYPNYNIVYGEWIQFTAILTVDLTRVQFSLVNYQAAPVSGQLKLEIKDYYIYDADEVDPELLEYIVNQQESNYHSGTTTYSLKVASDEMASSFGKINVKNHGVKGDGITDDTDAINKLFSIYAGNFYFPTGEYKISGTITLPDKSELSGDGDATIINMYNSYSLHRLLFRGSDYVYPYIQAGHFCKIHDIKLVGNNNLQTERHYGIGVVDVSNVSIHDVTIYNINYDPDRNDGDPSPVVSAYGIGALRSQKVNIERCYVEQCGYECIGIADYSKDCVVKDCITKNGWRTCIQVHRGVKNVLIENCYMIQSHEKYDACFTLHGLSGDDLVENLRVENCTAIMTVTSVTGQQYDYCAPYQFMSYCYDAWCINNKASGGKRALYVGDSVAGFKMIGNQLQCNDSSDYGITVLGDNALLIGNTVINDADSGNNIAASAVKAGNIGIS